MKRKWQRMEMMQNLMMTGLNNMIGTECQMIRNMKSTLNINICCGSVYLSL